MKPTSRERRDRGKAIAEHLTEAGYKQTARKLARLEQRVARLEERTDLSPRHLGEAQRSCQQMISQYRREMKLYEFDQKNVPHNSPHPICGDTSRAS